MAWSSLKLSRLQSAWTWGVQATKPVHRNDGDYLLGDALHDGLLTDQERKDLLAAQVDRLVQMAKAERELDRLLEEDGRGTMS
jgi:hypothetical protein